MYVNRLERYNPNPKTMVISEEWNFQEWRIGWTSLYCVSPAPRLPFSPHQKGHGLTIKRIPF